MVIRKDAESSFKPSRLLVQIDGAAGDLVSFLMLAHFPYARARSGDSEREAFHQQGAGEETRVAF
jgi:hypothetical protein